MIKFDSRYQTADNHSVGFHSYTSRREVELTEEKVPSENSTFALYRTTAYYKADTTSTTDEYMVRDYDTMELLATKYLGNPGYWWKIAEANPHIRYPLDLKMGDFLVIPE